MFPVFHKRCQLFSNKKITQKYVPVDKYGGGAGRKSYCHFQFFSVKKGEFSFLYFSSLKNEDNFETRFLGT